MAKELEGEHYYYGPRKHSVELYQIYSRNGSVDPIAVGLNQKNASLIVDALNQWEDLNKIEREYEETVRLHPNGPT